MIQVKSFDLTGLNVMMHRIQTELHKSAKEVVETTAGRLVKDLVAASPPKNKKRSLKDADIDVAQVFSSRTFDDQFEGQKAGRKKSEIKWLIAGPFFLLGIKNENIKTGSSLSEMTTLYSDRQKVPFGKRYEKIGRISSMGRKGGLQNVTLLNRYWVSKAKKNSFTKKVQDRFGKMKAGWAMGWADLKVKGRLPAWVSKHIKQGNRLGEVLMSTAGDKPTITIINRARGVEGEASLKAIKAACAKRFGAMKKDLENQLKGLYKRVTA